MRRGDPAWVASAEQEVVVVGCEKTVALDTDPSCFNLPRDFGVTLTLASFFARFALLYLNERC